MPQPRKLSAIACAMLCALVACSSVVQAQTCVGEACKRVGKVVAAPFQQMQANRFEAQQARAFEVDTDGAVITSYGAVTTTYVVPYQPVAAPVLPPQVMQATAPPVMEASVLRGSDSRAFKANLLKVAREARKNGDITPGQYLALAIAVQRPAALEEMRVGLQDSLVQDGLHDGVSAIDWSQFWQELLKYLPDLIALFLK